MLTEEENRACCCLGLTTCPRRPNTKYMKVVIVAVLRLLNTLELTTALPASPAIVVRHAADVATGGNFGPAILSKVLAHHEDVSVRKNEKGKTREIAEK